MTLILSTITERAVVQATDRRIVRGEDVMNEIANKTACVKAADALFAISFAGIAEIGTAGDEVDTASWLRSELHAMRPSSSRTRAPDARPPQ